MRCNQIKRRLHTATDPLIKSGSPHSLRFALLLGSFPTFWGAFRRARASGIVYASVRRPSGTNLVVYHPSLLPPVLEGDHFDYRWTGNAMATVLKLTGVGGALTWE